MSPVPRWPSRYAVIDAWRGLAALGVVLTHVTRNLFGVEHEWIVGHECVLIFFVISGYCITASSEATWSTGIRSFMRRRIRRIYPPYFFALIFYAATRFAKIAVTQAGAPASWNLLSWIQNLTLTQWLSMLGSPGAMPWYNPVNFVPAFWSLQHEEQFYIVSGLLLLAAPFLRLTAVLLMMATSLGWITLAPLRTATPYHGLFLEMWFYFGLGVLVFYRLCRFERRELLRLVDVALSVLLGAAVVGWLSARSHVAPNESALRHVVVVTSFALFLIAFRPLDAWLAGRGWFRPAMALGAITYSLYLVHQFNVVFVATLVGSVIPNRWLAVSIVCQLGAHIAIAACFWRFFERPYLNRPTVAASLLVDKP
jgi:peptidoglycan/LPS O-acetylase OafA/YrhL